MFFSKQEKTIVFNVVRQFVYFCVVFAFVLFLVYLSSIYHSKTFAEHGVVENIQLGLLLSSGLIFLVQLKLRPEYACVLWLLASCSFLAACRELDMFFDEHLPVISWRIGFIFPLIAFGKAYQYSYCLKKTLIRFFTSPSFYMMSCSMIIIIPVAQCIGHRPLMVNVLNTTGISAVKELFEEACEAVGYLMILLSSIECYFSLPKTVNLKINRK